MSGVTKAHVTPALTGQHAPVQRGKVCGVMSIKRGALAKAYRVVSAGGRRANKQMAGPTGCTLLVCVCIEVPRAARSPVPSWCTCMCARKAPPCTGVFSALPCPSEWWRWSRAAKASHGWRRAASKWLQRLMPDRAASCPFASAGNVFPAGSNQATPTAH